MRCPNCGSTNRPDLRFCEQCGAALPVAAEAPPLLCPRCGAANPPGHRFCEQCAAPLASPAAAATRPARRRLALGLLALALFLAALFVAWRFLLPHGGGVSEAAGRRRALSQSEALTRATEIVVEEYPQFAGSPPEIQDIELGPDQGYRLVYRGAEITETNDGPVEFKRTLVIGVNAATGETVAAVSQ